MGQAAGGGGEFYTSSFFTHTDAASLALRANRHARTNYFPIEEESLD